MDKLAEFDDTYFESKINQLHFVLLDSGCVELDSSWRWEDVSSPFNRLYFILEGKGTLITAQRSIALTPDFVYLIPAHSKNTYLCNHAMKQLFVAFQMEIAPGCDFFKSAFETLCLPVDASFLQLLQTHVRTNSIANVLWFKAKIYEFLSDFAEKCTGDAFATQAVHEKYKPVYTMIEACIAQRMSVSQICRTVRALYASPLRSFQTDTQYTLRAYVQKRMMQKAKEALASSNRQVQEIAFTLGFTDEFYFSRVFKQHCGVSPTEYRNHCSPFIVSVK